ncbi:hypothetical protein BGW80DRAFT_1274384 [Lactifluus volemus]|nr:hypothetical protein BGW80DRAFT_1274384 [Lactifluus volemus]
MPDTSGCQSSTADVAGIGIRVNVYATLVLLAIIPVMPETEEILVGLYSMAGLAGLGLLVTAIILTAKNQLSLFDALFVFHILFFLGIGATPTGKYKHSMARFIIGVVSQFIGIFAFTGWALYLWIRVRHFGPENQCNDQVKYFFMFVDVEATEPWLRGIWIAILAVSALLLSVRAAVHSFSRYVDHEIEKRKREMEDEEDNEDKDAERVSVRERGLTTEGEGERKDKGWYFKMMILQFLWAVYAIVTLELMVWRNNVNHGGVVTMNDAYTWAFGQVLAVVMLAAALNEIVHFLLGHINVKRKRRAHPRVTQVEGAADAASQHPEGHVYPPGRHPGYASVPERTYSPTSPAPRAADQPIGLLR